MLQIHMQRRTLNSVKLNALKVLTVFTSKVILLFIFSVKLIYFRLFSPPVLLFTVYYHMMKNKVYHCCRLFPPITLSLSSLSLPILKARESGAAQCASLAGL